MKDILIDERYRVDRKIGEGGFGKVYSGTDLKSGEEVALKLTHIRGDTDALKNEERAYQAVSGGVGMPSVRWFGEECEYYVLVHDLLGPSLEDLFNYCGRKLSLKTILLIADQAITRIAHIHSKGIFHRDIKPDNFLMGIGRRGNVLYTVDFGMAEEHEPDRDKPFEGLHFGGTHRYASINNHNGREQSWGDDLESLGYMFLYFARGSLPWQGLKVAKTENKNQLVKEKKESLSGVELCTGFLPDEFATYIDYTRSLGFGEKPDYKYLRRLFRRLLRSEGFKYDNIFDWTEKRFREVCSEFNLATPSVSDAHQQAKRPSRLRKTARKRLARGVRRHQPPLRRESKKR
ncbi:casein kinase I isoform delta [Biscogniauxia marginata]|nr:casein kinase I isoform delta [Biscogniauxia marginata]